MDEQRKIPDGISIVYFNEPEKTIHANLPPDKDQEKKVAKRIFRHAMTDLSATNNETEQELPIAQTTPK